MRSRSLGPNDTVERRAVPATQGYGTLSTRDSLHGQTKIFPRVRSNRKLEVSRTYLNARAVRDYSVDLLNFRIRQGNATNRPVNEAMGAPDPP